MLAKKLEIMEAKTLQQSIINKIVNLVDVRHTSPIISEY
jgi:hypothetical protein